MLGFNFYELMDVLKLHYEFSSEYVLNVFKKRNLMLMFELSLFVLCLLHEKASSLLSKITCLSRKRHWRWVVAVLGGM